MRGSQEGVGRYQMMGDISNCLVLRLMNEQVSKTRRPDHHPMRLVPRLVLSRLVGRLVHISACPYMPYSLYRPVRSCSSGLVRSRLIAQRSTQRRYRHTNIIPYIHRILVSLYSCIFYIHRIHHIHYIHQSTRHDEPHADIQTSSRRPASRPVRLESNERHEARAIATENEKQATMSQMGTPHAHTPRSHSDRQRAGTTMMRTALPHPPRRHQGKQAPIPKRHDGELPAHPLTAEMRREAEAFQLHETTRRDDERYGHDATPHDTRRATRDGTDNHGKTPQHHGQPRPTRRTDTMGRASTPRRPSPQDMEERATRRSTRRNDEKRTRRQANDEGKHYATPQDK